MDEPKDAQRGKPAGPRKKQPRKVSPRYLENAALHYLKRYSATVSQLKRVLPRRVDRSLRFHGGERSEAAGWVEALVEKLVRNGLLNDQAYAEQKAHSLPASGRSSRVIARKPRLKGVSAEVVERKLAEATTEVSEDAAARGDRTGGNDAPTAQPNSGAFNEAAAFKKFNPAFVGPAGPQRAALRGGDAAVHRLHPADHLSAQPGPSGGGRGRWGADLYLHAPGLRTAQPGGCQQGSVMPPLSGTRSPCIPWPQVPESERGE